MNKEEELRFIGKIDGMDDPVSCWIWMGSRDWDGYGRFFQGGHLRRAHRLSAEYWGRLKIQGLQVCHHCDNPSCVNPLHLFVGTAQDNALDADAKGRPRNHPSRPVVTPIGDFPSMGAAARALNIDWTTLNRRIAQGQKGYRFR